MSLPGYTLQQLSPDAAVLLGSAGLALIFVEFNRPGRILPAALGLLLALFAAASWQARGGPRIWAALLLLSVAGLLLLNLYRRIPLPLLGIATLAGIAALRFLSPAASAQQVSLPVAILCGGLLGAAGILLTRIALRARRAKALD